MPDPKTYHFKLPGPFPGPQLPEPPNSLFPGVEAHMSRVTGNRLLRSDGKIRAFVIHATAGSSSAGAMSVFFAHRASWHWLVPDENEAEHGRHVWACAFERRAAFHVRPDRSHPDVNNGSRNVNFWSLGVEVVNSQQNDAYSAWQTEQTAALVRYAWSKYPELRDVVSHAKLDPARRTDPGANFDWEHFKQLVLNGPPQTDASPLSLADGRFADAGLAEEPITIVSPRGEQIACNPRMIEGVTMVEARPLIEALGFSVNYKEPMTMEIARGGGGDASRGSKAAAREGAGKASAKKRGRK